MALHWQFHGATMQEPQHMNPFKGQEDKIHPMADYMIWATMFIGMPEISKKTANEFHRRLAMHELVTGPAMEFNDGTKVYTQLSDVVAYMGLRTNASSLSKREFHTQLIRKLESRVGEHGTHTSKDAEGAIALIKRKAEESEPTPECDCDLVCYDVGCSMRQECK